MLLACKDVRPSIYELLVEAETAMARHKIAVLVMYQGAIGQARLEVNCTFLSPSASFSNPILVEVSGDT